MGGGKRIMLDWEFLMSSFGIWYVFELMCWVVGSGYSGLTWSLWSWNFNLPANFKNHPSIMNPDNWWKKIQESLILGTHEIVFGISWEAGNWLLSSNLNVHPMQPILLHFSLNTIKKTLYVCFLMQVLVLHEPSDLVSVNANLWMAIMYYS